MRATRVLLGVLGLAMIGFGVFRIVQNANITKPVNLLEWLAGAVLVHDLVLLPLVTLLGLVLSRTVPSRARGYLQGFLVIAAVVLGLAAVMRYRSPVPAASEALLARNYLVSGGIVVGCVGAVTALAYAVRVVRDRAISSRTTSPTTNSPAADRR